MKLKTNKSLRDKLNGAATKREYLDILHEEFQDGRRFICSIDGVEFRNCALTGTLLDDGKSITKIGAASDTTSYLAADLSGRTGTLRIQSGDNYIEGTLGLDVGAAFVIDENPTTENGIGIRSIHIDAPAHLPDGPPVPDDAPYYVVLEDYSTGSPVEAQTVAISSVQSDIEYQHPVLAGSLGAIPYSRAPEPLILGSGGYAVEIGIHLFKLPGSCNADNPGTPAYQILGPIGVHERWPEYPFAATYDIETDSTILPPHKLAIYTQGMELLGRIEMHDGIPVNDPSMSQSRTADDPLRPFFNCKMMLYWESAKLARQDHVTQFNPGFNPDYYRPSQVKSPHAENPLWPILDTWSGTGQQSNGLGHIHALPDWAMSINDSIGNSNDPIASDPYLYDVGSYYSGDGPRGYSGRAMGQRYEPAAAVGHEWNSRAGGTRSPRHGGPESRSQLAISVPNELHLKSGTPWVEVAREHMKGYFNYSMHMFTDASKLEMPEYSTWVNKSYQHTYYSPNAAYVPEDYPGQNHINAFVPLSGGWPAPDRDNLRQFSGFGTDMLHSYACPVWGLITFGSVAHTISAKARYFDQILGQIGRAPTSNPAGDYLSGGANAAPFLLDRRQAWRLGHHCQAWISGTNHPIGIPQSFAEDLMQQELEAIYDNIVIPYEDDEHEYHNHHFIVGLRNFGIPLVRKTNSTQHWYSFLSDGKTFYLAGEMMTMKLSGFWDVMHAKSAKCASALDHMIEWLDRYSIDFIKQTDGRIEGAREPAGPGVPADSWLRACAAVPLADPLTIYDDWQDFADARAPRVGAEDLVHDANGDIYVLAGPNIIDRDPAQHDREFYVFTRKYYFPEYAHPDLDDVIAMYEGWEQDVADWVAAGSTPAQQRARDFQRRHPAVVPPLPPLEVE